jgi:hypothetical protein
LLKSCLLVIFNVLIDVVHLDNVEIHSARYAVKSFIFHHLGVISLRGHESWVWAVGAVQGSFLLHSIHVFFGLLGHIYHRLAV